LQSHSSLPSTSDGRLDGSYGAGPGGPAGDRNTTGRDRRRTRRAIARRRAQQFLFLVLAFVAIAAASGALALRTPLLWTAPDGLLALGICGAAYAVTALLVLRLTRFPQVEAGGLVFVIVLFLGGAATGVGASISTTPILLYINTFAFTFVFLLAWVLFRRNIPLRPLIVVPGGVADEILSLEELNPRYTFRRVAQPDEDLLHRERIGGVIVDTQERRESHWVRFLSQCSLQGIDVYPADQVFESLYGRVSLRHLQEGVPDGYQVSVIYRVVKRLNGIAVVLASLPIVLPMALITAIAIKLDSRGPLIFTQERVGEGNETFRMYKFRSMRHGGNDENDGNEKTARKARFADSEEDRITRVGRFIRKYRLDELPQFLNILSGDMSLIGPRPEQVDFVRQFEKEIPFYGYRHMVKPGITGWAQVNHGYASDEQETRTKLEHDLYYVKHFSLWIDLVVGIKTVRTILTGFGAR